MFIYSYLTALIGLGCGSKKRFFGGGGWVVCFLACGAGWVEEVTEMIVRQSGLIMRKRAKNSLECLVFLGRILTVRAVWARL
jgi:hypothetical protein